jgi:hypothetical protein
MTLIPTLERELIAAARREYHHPRQRWLLSWPTLAATTSGITAVVVAALLLLSSGTPAAFAGWTSTPTVPAGSALTQVRAVCGHVPQVDVVAAESRGPFTAIVYVRGGTPWQCVSRGSQVLIRHSTPYPPNVVIAPAPGKVSVPIVNQRVIGTAANRSLQVLLKREDALYRGLPAVQLEKAAAGATARALRAAETKIILGSNSLSIVSGSVGRGVSGVTFVLRDGTKVKATVGHGWYLAWWPGTTDPNKSFPTAIRVTTVNGMTTSPYTASYLSELYRPCLAFQTCPDGLSTIRLVRGVSPSITKHFGLFRNTPAVSLKDATSRSHLSLIPGAAPVLGLDDSQIRKVSFGSAGTIWVTPGTEGACVKLGSATDINATDTGGGGCTNLQGVLQKGVIISSNQAIVGLVADGNTSVTVCMTSGHRITVPVKDNVFYRVLPGRAGTIYLKNAYGKPTHQLVWVSKRC